MDLVVVSENHELGFASSGGPLVVFGDPGFPWLLTSVCICVWAFGFCCGCLCKRAEAPATWTPPAQPTTPTARWELIAQRAVNFVRARRRLSLAFAHLGTYSLRNTQESRPNHKRRTRRAATPGPILHEGPALDHGSHGSGAERDHGLGRGLHMVGRGGGLGTLPPGSAGRPRPHQRVGPRP